MVVNHSFGLKSEHFQGSPKFGIGPGHIKEEPTYTTYIYFA